MIRELQKADINKVADIWLDTNIKTHYFIPAQYWKSNFGLVKEQQHYYRQLSMFTRISRKYRGL